MKERIQKCIEDDDYTKSHQRIESISRKPVYILGIIACAVVFVVFERVQTLAALSYIGGIIAQLQVTISVFLVAAFYKVGLISAICLNVYESMITAVQCITLNNKAAVPGIIVPIITIAICGIIYIQMTRQKKDIALILKQREELMSLSEEIASSYDEMQATNETLIEKNRIIENNEEKLRFLAFYDVLTELPNRRMILKKVDFLIDFCSTNSSGFALAVIDLDNFKKINDSLGHQNGDEILKEISRRLSKSVHSDDIVARLSGDEFAILIQRQMNDDMIESYINVLRALIRKPIAAGNIMNTVNSSAGIAVFPRDGQDVDEILKCADLAEHKAKLIGRNSVVFFDSALKDDMLRRLNYETRLMTALKNNEFFLMYQPQYFSDSKRLRGFETLVRWQEPELGLISPSQFIPLAEEIGIINELGEWILRTACNKLKQIDEEYHGDFILSINISAIQLMQPDFIDIVERILKETGIIGSRLEFEITESVFISALDRAAEILGQIKKLGILIALDDFGTGYSSLNYLYRLPIDTLKIDKSFIDRLISESSEDDEKHIVGSIIALAHDMNMSIVAEGVEAEKQLRYLKTKQCDIIQGFLWGKPLSEDLFREVLDNEFKKTNNTDNNKTAVKS